VSSSSSTEGRPEHEPIATLLARAFEELQTGCPRAYAETVRLLGEFTVRITVDDETFDVYAEHGTARVRVREPRGLTTVSIRTSRATIRDVLAARSTLRDALNDDELRAAGRMSDLVAVLEALEAFVHGAVRCDAIAQLYREFQSEKVA
jgi:hypothetical protein